MSIPAIGLSINCSSECVQCCPDKLSIFCCCCRVDDNQDSERPPLKHRVKRRNKREAQPTIIKEEGKGDKVQYVCVHRQDTEQEGHRTDAVAIAAIQRHNPLQDDKPGCGGCTIL